MKRILKVSLALTCAATVGTLATTAMAARDCPAGAQGIRFVNKSFSSPPVHVQYIGNNEGHRHSMKLLPGAIARRCIPNKKFSLKVVSGKHPSSSYITTYMNLPEPVVVQNGGQQFDHRTCRIHTHGDQPYCSGDDWKKYQV